MARGGRIRVAALLTVAALGVGCGAPKEAADPHELIVEDLPPPAFGDAGDAPTRAELGGPGASSPRAGSDPPATRSECEAAARRTMEIRLRADGRRERETEPPGDLDDVATRAAQECVAWETPRSEARCVARAHNEADVEACVR